MLTCLLSSLENRLSQTCIKVTKSKADSASQARHVIWTLHNTLSLIPSEEHRLWVYENILI